MFERIVLAVDGSEHSKKAIPVAGELAEKFSGEVTVYHVREHDMSWSGDIDSETIEEANEIVDEAVRQLKDRGVSARSDIFRAPFGLAAQQIVKEAQAQSADIIVMGTRGLTDWKGLLLGSVAHRVISHAGCPVLLVR